MVLCAKFVLQREILSRNKTVFSYLWGGGGFIDGNVYLYLVDQVIDWLFFFNLVQIKISQWLFSVKFYSEGYEH